MTSFDAGGGFGVRFGCGIDGDDHSRVSSGGGDANALKYVTGGSPVSLALVHGLHDPHPHPPLVSPVELAESFLLFFL